MVLKEWNQVEAQFASAYGLGVQDIFAMSWRRFRVLFGGVFSWNEAEETPKRIADTVDWSQARHTPVKSLGQGVGDLGVPVNRLPVGGSGG